MMVAGIGCRKGVTPDAVSEAIATALERCRVSRSQIDALSTELSKSSEAAILATAESLALPLVFVSHSEMELVAGHTLTSSTRVIALKGVPSVAETAALAAAGRSARLLAPRITTKTVTCAIAVGEGR